MFWLILSLIVMHSLGHLWLEYLNLKNLKRNQGKIPTVFEDKLDPEEVGRAERYTRERLELGLVNFLLAKGLLLAIVILGGLVWYSDWLAAFGFGPVTTGLLYFGGLIFVGKIVSLPLEWYETFSLEERYGFNITTVRLWIFDLIREYILTSIIGVVLLGAVFYILYEAGTYWWLICWGFVAFFSLLLTELYPILIAPIFNKFTPIDNDSLKEKVIGLMGKCGIEARGVFVMDAGRRSRHTNAYFTGIGKAKRIVLFDTLVEKHSEEEILAILAHEAGHWRKGHVIRSLLMSQGMALAFFAFTGWIVEWAPLYDSFGFGGMTPYAGLLLACLIYGPVVFFFGPLFSWMSRRFEYEADRYARDMGLADALCTSLIQLSTDNLANLKPHPTYVFFNYSHPPVTKRIEALKFGPKLFDDGPVP